MKRLAYVLGVLFLGAVVTVYFYSYSPPKVTEHDKEANAAAFAWGVYLMLLAAPTIDAHFRWNARHRRCDTYEMWDNYILDRANQLAWRILKIWAEALTHVAYILLELPSASLFLSLPDQAGRVFIKYSICTLTDAVIDWVAGHYDIAAAIICDVLGVDGPIPMFKQPECYVYCDDANTCYYI